QRLHTSSTCDGTSDVCSSYLVLALPAAALLSCLEGVPIVGRDRPSGPPSSGPEHSKDSRAPRSSRRRETRESNRPILPPSPVCLDRKSVVAGQEREGRGQVRR